MASSSMASTRRTVQFGPVEIAYGDSVLEPRPWTLGQSHIAATMARSVGPGPILELCCGAGQIGLAAAAWTGRRLVSVDNDPTACSWADFNAAQNELPASVHCRDVALVADAADAFPLVIADPPYLSSAEAVRGDDPHHAVDGGPDGLQLVDHVLRSAATHVGRAGVVVCQLGSETQVEAVMHSIGPSVALEAVDVHRFGPDRNVLVLRPGSSDPAAA